MILASDCPVQHPPHPTSACKKHDVNRDKQEAHLSLPGLHTKTTKAEEETHWVLETVWYALSLQPTLWHVGMSMNAVSTHGQYTTGH